MATRDREGTMAGTAWEAGAPTCEGRDRMSDLLFHFAEGQALDVLGLSLLLTARQMAHEDRRRVWLTGLDFRNWRALEAMGLGGLFLHFPARAKVEA